MFKELFKSNRIIPNQRAPNTYVSPLKHINCSCSLPTFRNRKIPQRRRSSSIDYRKRYNQPFTNRSRSITPNRRNIAFHNSHNPRNHSHHITPPYNNSTNKFRNSPRSLAPLPMVNQNVDTSEVFRAASLDSRTTVDQFLVIFLMLESIKLLK